MINGLNVVTNTLSYIFFMDVLIRVFCGDLYMNALATLYNRIN